jgi:hypothetical protein
MQARRLRFDNCQKRVTFRLIAPSYEYANNNGGDEKGEQAEEMPAARKDPEISGG